ncbi:MAG: BMC domain-containing protein [Bacillota bacterium]|nr:BMC domain-containing protein [Bacillota bacterium]MDP4156202.1 BMC domain-containing protein [Bacillota bacterium]
MQSLGLIETTGLLAAIQGADAMLKAAEVTLVDKTNVGGGLVSITVTGDVAAVKAAVESGTAAIRQINGQLLISSHVIPRPHEELENLIFTANPFETMSIINSDSMETVPQELVDDEPLAEEKRETTFETEELHKNIFDQIVFEYGIDEAIKVLSKLRVTKLRHLAREFKELGMAGRTISKADKKTLLESFKDYYGQHV